MAAVPSPCVKSFIFDCCCRFEEDYLPNNEMARSALTGYGAGTNWYVDSGAADDIPSELEKMKMREKYSRHDQVHTASGSGIQISNIGHPTLQTPTCDLQLNHILHVPRAHKKSCVCTLFSC